MDVSSLLLYTVTTARLTSARIRSWSRRLAKHFRWRSPDGPQVGPSFLRVKTKGDDTTSLVISTAETTLGAVNLVVDSTGVFF
jgi:hypothetical protein